MAILRNESISDHMLWEKVCQDRHEMIDYEIISLQKSDWFSGVMSGSFDLILLRPPGRTEKYKRLYDERTYLLSHFSNIIIYPALIEILLYENKRFLRDWMMVNEIPHPKTEVFYSGNEALDFLNINIAYPLVAKVNIGASGNGVTFLQNESQAKKYIIRAFNSGVNSRTGPKLNKGSLWKKAVKALTIRGFVKNRLAEYRDTYTNPQMGFLIFQEFIPHEFEWRCVRIGDSYFAHKKIAKNNKSSGTLIKSYDSVPLNLLDFVHEITERTKLSSVAIDIFERDGLFLVNEIQSFFGQSDPYQMLVNNIPGRYRLIEGEWIFEEGNFASNECYDLRIEHALKLLRESGK